MQAIDLIEKVKKEAGIKSDYALAKILKISTARMSDYKAGRVRPDTYTLTKMALLLNVEPIEIIAEYEADNEKNEDKKEFWQSFRSHIGKAAVIMLAIGCTLSSPNEAQAGGKNEAVHNCILC